MSRHLIAILTAFGAVLAAPRLAAAATVLRCGETTEQEIVQKFDFVTFEANENEVVSITTAAAAGQDPNFAPEFQVEGPDGDLVVLADGSRTCVSVVHQCETGALPATGTYTIIVNDNGKKQKGRYFLTLEAVSATAQGLSNGPPSPVCARINGGGKADGTQALPFDLLLGGSIDTPGETDTFAFAAEAGQTVSLRMEAVLPPPGSFDPRWKLFDPAGQAVDGDCSAGAACSRGPLGAGGTYTVKVFDGDYAGVGSYTLLLEDPTATTTTTSTTTTTTTTVAGPTTTTTTVPGIGGASPYELSHTLRRTANVTPASVGEELGVSIAADAAQLIIGVPYDQTDGPVSGRAYVLGLEGFVPEPSFGRLAQVLPPPPAAAGPKDRFGAAVAIVGDGFAVGAPGASVAADRSGAVYVYPGGGQLTAPQPKTDSEFGAVLTAAGVDLFVGAPADGAGGEGRVYRFSGGNPLQVFGGVENDPALATVGAPQTGDRFGTAIATFQDATQSLLAIGAPGDGTRPGRVFLLDRIQGRWQVVQNLQPANGDGFGRALTFVDSTLIIGAPGVSRVFRVIGGQAVAILDRPDLPGLGTSLATLGGSFLAGAPGAGGAVLRADPTGAAIQPEFRKAGVEGDERYGEALAVSAGRRVFIGAPGDDAGSVDGGAVYDYLLGVTGPEAIFRKRRLDVGFGSAIAANEATVAVGAPNESGIGAVFTFEARPAGCPAQGCLALAQVTGATAGARFGQSVALIGSAALVGAPFGRDPNGAEVGTARLAQLPPGRIADVENPAAQRLAGDQFGFAVAAVANDLLVAAPLSGSTDTGAVYVFDGETQRLALTLAKPVPTTGDFFGAAIAVEGDTVAVGAPFDSTAADKAGAVYLFRRSTAELIQGEPLVSGVPSSRELFGASVAMDADWIVVGAPSEDALEPGRIYLFERGTRALVRTIDNPAGGQGDHFGSAVALVNGQVLVGAPFADTSAADGGAAFLFDPVTGAIVQRFENPVPATFDRFGAAVAAGPAGLLIGAPGSSRVYAFRPVAQPSGIVAALDALGDVFVGTAIAAGPQCGNGVVETGEQCDDGNAVDGDDCRNDCTGAACCVIDPGTAARCNDFDPCTDDSLDPATNRCVNIDNGQCCNANSDCAGQDGVCRICAGCSLFPWDCCEQGATCLLASPGCRDLECFEQPLCECQGGLTCSEPGSEPTDAMEDAFRQACDSLRLENDGAASSTPMADARGAVRTSRRALKLARGKTKQAFKKGEISKPCRGEYLETIRLVRRSIPTKLRRCVADK